ncbi:carboxypeptidase-like regulatory domain-containing protein [Psychroserpens sp. NJDZ02]|uniref:carboxypeptidase-like regulatory domain-containing protein n=1 Tax=Psychroserpens sp. NJDZ02 TaxID=2570561 RepID=UPI0010A8F900|nr:carboxypeptidase-like regulatory domain-containing protein [Psychroserpens sp. NJDZ02]QCE43045.1 carboxypeptidase-like regulatory domain-containing protein [Psychroserpens sp. NJDZ02]
MRILFILIIALLYNLPSYCQNNEQFESGKIYKIYGQITDETTKDTLNFAILEFMDTDNGRIKVTMSDFDGMYSISFCSNKIKNDTLLLKTTKAFYKEKKSYYKIDSDTIINISMTLEKDRVYTEKELKRLKKGIGFFECGVDDNYLVDEMAYQKNETTYRHYCSGLKKKYRSLIDENADFSEWILVE